MPIVLPGGRRRWDVRCPSPSTLLTQRVRRKQVLPDRVICPTFREEQRRLQTTGVCCNWPLAIMQPELNHRTGLGK